MTDASPRQIEREIEEERSALEQSIEALQSQFSADAIVGQASEYMRTHGQDLVQSASRAAKENPMALALTGIGVAWLIAGSGTKSQAPAPTNAAYDPSGRPTAQGFASTEPPMAGFDARVAAADDAIQQELAQERAKTFMTADPVPHEGETMTSRIENTWANAKARTHQVKHHIAETAAHLRDRLDEGTDDLPDYARERVMRARAAAVAAQERVEEHAIAARNAARQTTRDNPLLVGALTFAAGAALAAMLPRTQTENNLVGAQRDRLMAEADRIFQEEKYKLKSVAQAAVAEGRAVAEDLLDRGADTPDSASAVSRIANAAKSTARSEGLGDVS